MSFITHIRIFFSATVCAALLFGAVASHGAMDPRFEIDPQVLSDRKNPVKPVQTSPKRSSVPSVSRTVTGNRYTVKSGDDLIKTVMRDHGLSASEADAFLEEIRLENNILDIRRLKTGQKVVIPPVRRKSDGSLILDRSARASSYLSTGGAAPKQLFTLETPALARSGQEETGKVSDVWDRIVPQQGEGKKPLKLQTATFSLTLDPVRYPAFARMDGGQIILDQQGSIPPLVKALIEERDTSIRIVTEPISQPRRFMASLLEAGGFFSVEENFTMEFGADPKLTVQTDFKIEKTAESLIKQDIVLVNSGRSTLPLTLTRFLKQEGFSVHEPFATSHSLATGDSRAIHAISSHNQPDMIDAILTAFSVTPDREHRVDVFGADNNGISLAVKAERYFERGGQRYVITHFDGDPINYTLFRILEAKGYNVVMLESKDDFRRVAEKIIARMKIRGSFAQHDLLRDRTSGYSLQMSGFKLDDALLPGGGIFLTDRTMSQVVRDLVTEHGFTIR